MASHDFTGLVPLLQVHDMTESLAFYRDGLGFEVLDATEPVEDGGRRYVHWCWLRRGGADLMLNTRYDTGEQPAQRDPSHRPGHGNVSLYLSHPDLDALYAELSARGLAPAEIVETEYGARELNLVDPDGFAIAVHEMGG